MGIDTIVISFVLLLVAVANISIGLIVLLSGFRDSQRKWFVSAVSWSSLWVLTNAFYPHIRGTFQMETALVSYGAAALVGVSVVGLCLRMTGLSVSHLVQKLYFAIGMLIAVTSALPGVIAVGISKNLIINTQPVAFGIYSLFIVFSFMAGAILLAIKYRQAKRLERAKLRLVLFGLIGAIATGITFNLLLPSMGNYRYIQLGPSGTIFFLAASAFAMVRYKLLDVRLVAVRTVAYIMSVAVLASIYFILAYLASLAIFHDDITNGISLSPVNVVLALVLAFIFQPIKQFFDQATDRIFYRDRYDTSVFLIRIGRILTSTTELHVLLAEVSREIRQTLKANGVLFLVYRNRHANEIVHDGSYQGFDDNELMDIAETTSVFGNGLLIVNGLEDSMSAMEQRIQAIFSKKKVSLVLPLISADETIGYLMIGEHLDKGYSKHDIEALETIANELVIAIQNAKSVQVVRDLNANLEQRITSATKELRASNAQLRRLDAAKDEFVSMASHQLRTPLTSVKGYISMVLEGDAGEITGAQRKLLEEAFTSSERMVHLISDFLNVSRLQTGKFVIEKDPIDLAKLVGQEVESLASTAEAHSLKLRYRQPAHFPVLYVDEGKIRQVVMNFIDNAIYYSPEHSTITADLAIEDGDAVFTVRDNGIGVPAAQQAHLFTKFFRADNARRQRPDGTGVGLFLAKKVIVAHGGSIVFESVEGEGSTFGFRLPIKKLSEAPAANGKPTEMAAKP